MERYELIEGSAAKFWQWEVRGQELVVEYGRIGTKGQSSTKTLATEAAAREAATKLVKEKTGKGYQLAGAAAAQVPVEAKAAPAPAVVSKDTTLPPWLTQAEFDDLSARIAKNKKGDLDALAIKVLGDDEIGGWGTRIRRATATVAWLFEHGHIPRGRLADVVRPVLWASAFVTPELLLELLRDPAFPPAFVPAYLRALAQRAPQLLDRAPAHPELAVIRRDFGLTHEPLSDADVQALAKRFIAGAFSSLQRMEDGVLVTRIPTTFSEAEQLVRETYGIADWSDRVLAALREGDVNARDWNRPWRFEPLALRGTEAEFTQLIERAHHVDGAVLQRWLAARGDNADFLCTLARTLKPVTDDIDSIDAHKVRDNVAVFAGAKCVSEGKPVPPELDEMLWFLDNRPVLRTNEAYAAALSKWPADRVLARVRQVLELVKLEQQKSTPSYKLLASATNCLVALTAHPEPELTRQIIDGIQWNLASPDPTLAGRLPLDWLPVLVEKTKTVTGTGGVLPLHRAIHLMIVSSAEKAGAPFAAELDVHFAPKNCNELSLFARAVALLPQERRDAYLLAWAKLNPYETLPFHLASDAALDELVRLMFEKRNLKSVFVTYPMGVSFGGIGDPLARCGARVRPLLLKHWAKTPRDAKAVELMRQLPVVVDVDTAPAPPPPVDGETTGQLNALCSELASEKPVASFKLKSGALLVATSGHDTPRSLRRKLPAGTELKVRPRYDDALEGATAGLDGIVFEASTQAVARWEEVPDVLDGNVLTLLFGDETAFEKLDDEARDEVDGLVDDHHASGDAIALHKKTLLFAYVGEVMTSHRLFWGLDSAGQPVCLVARFS